MSHSPRTCIQCGSLYPTKHPERATKYCSRACHGKAIKGVKVKTDVERFWSKVNKDGPVPEHRPELGPCWVWTASTVHHGYGYFFYDEGSSAHRFGYIVQVGPIPEGHDVLHHCDNPPCVRGDHLFTGTAKDNGVDMSRKGRCGSTNHPETVARGERQHNATLTAEQVVEIRALRASGETYVAIAQKYPVGKDAIGVICRRKNWVHVKD